MRVRYGRKLGLVPVARCTGWAVMSLPAGFSSSTVAVLALAGGYFARLWLATDSPAQDPGEVLLAARLNDPTGQPQAMAQWQGKVLVVNFWATWCPPCLKEIPEFVRLQEQLRAQRRAIRRHRDRRVGEGARLHGVRSA